MGNPGGEDDAHGVDFLGRILLEPGEEEKRCEPEAEPKDQATEEQLHQLRSIGAAVRIRQLRSRGLSFQLWPAASALVSLLDHAPSLLLPSPPRPSSPLRILELGSGTGIVGIAAAAVLGAHVTITDLPHVLPNLQFNAEANAALVAARGGAVVVRLLCWGCEEDSKATGDVDDPFDLVLASDVVYHENLIDPLMQTLRFFVKGKVVFVMAHLRRWKKRDSVFFRKAKKIFDVEIIRKEPPLPGARVGVAVYRFVEKLR